MAGERNLTIALLAASILLSLLVFVAQGLFGSIATTALLAIAVLAPTLSFVLFKWGYWVVPYFTRGQRSIKSNAASFDMPVSEDVIVKRDGDTFYATMFAAVKIFRSSTTMTDQEKYAFMDLWERAVSGLKLVTKYGVLVYIKDLARYKESIEERKARAQMEIAKENENKAPDKAHLSALEREVSMWDNISAKLSLGDKPTAITTYIQVTAKGGSKDVAIASARQAVNEVRATVGTALNVEIASLSGEDMKRCFDWEFTVPASLKEI
jgi:hypothetical protein